MTPGPENCLASDIVSISRSLKTQCASYSPMDGATISAQAEFDSLHGPVISALQSPGKRMRPLLAIWVLRNITNDFSTPLPEEGSKSVENKSDLWKQTCEVAIACEAFHSASLVIDDIQDGSESRRGEPTVYRKHGMGVSINAATWMYFDALQKLQSLGLSEAGIHMLKLCHQGQSLDLATTSSKLIDLALEKDICESKELYENIANLKTAELMKFGASSVLQLLNKNGIVIEDSLSSRHEKLIRDYGFVYQMADDMRNLSSKLSHEKALEDLSSVRNYVVTHFIGMLSAEEKQALSKAAHNNKLASWIKTHELFPKATAECFDIISDKLGTLSLESQNLATSETSFAYINEVIHAPLVRLLNQVLSERSASTGSDKENTKNHCVSNEA